MLQGGRAAAPVWGAGGEGLGPGLAASGQALGHGPLSARGGASPVPVPPGRPPGLPPVDEPRPAAAAAAAAATVLLLLAVAAAWVSWELCEVTSESVLVLPGGVGYVLESVRRCGLRRRRFLDAREVSYVALSEVVTASDVRFFLSFVPRGDDDDDAALGAGAGAGSGGGGGRRLTVPYENLLPRLRLRHLRAIYRQLAPPLPMEEEEDASAGSCRKPQPPAPPPPAAAAVCAALQRAGGAAAGRAAETEGDAMLPVEPLVARGSVTHGSVTSPASAAPHSDVVPGLRSRRGSGRRGPAGGVLVS